MLGRNDQQATSEAPGFIEARVWADLGDPRQQLVLGELEGTQDITGDWPRLTANEWFTAVNDKVKNAKVLTVNRAGPDWQSAPRKALVSPNEALQDELSRQQEAFAPQAITEDMARDLVLGDYLVRLRTFIGSERADAVRREQATQAHTCPVCQARKATAQYLCKRCEAVQAMQATQEHAQAHGEAVKAWRSENNDRRPKPLTASDMPAIGNGQQ